MVATSPTLASLSFEALDDPLLEALRKIVTSDRRCISAVGGSGLFPDDTVFYDAPTAARNLRPHVTSEFSTVKSGSIALLGSRRNAILYFLTLITAWRSHQHPSTIRTRGSTSIGMSFCHFGAAGRHCWFIIISIVQIRSLSRSAS